MGGVFLEKKHLKIQKRDMFFSFILPLLLSSSVLLPHFILVCTLDFLWMELIR